MRINQCQCSSQGVWNREVFLFHILQFLDPPVRHFLFAYELSYDLFEGIKEADITWLFLFYSI